MPMKKHRLTWALGMGGAAILWSLATLGGYFFYTTGEPLGFIRFAKASETLRSYSLYSDSSLLDGAITGMVHSLGDTYGAYYYGDELTQFQNYLSGEYVGIGVYIAKGEDYPVIQGFLPGGSAKEAGLEVGDRLLSVDKESTKGKSLEDITKAIRGKAGETVHLEVERKGQTIAVDVTRQKVTINTVNAHMLNQDIGYIRIDIFSDHTGAEFASAFERLKEQGMKKWILDLRFNPGGNLEEAVKIGNVFLRKGTLTTLVDKDGRTHTYDVDGVDNPLPMAVLVNEQSASASELLAGAIQDEGVGKIIGTTTYGKGSVQSIYPIDEDRVIKITVAKYLTPKGREIDGVGIAPDIEVPFSFQDGYDRQLEKAMEVLNS